MSSALEQEIINKANITIASDYPIDNLDKIKQVIVAYKIQKKEFTPSALKKLLKRYGGTPTEDELIKLHSDANKAYAELKLEKRVIKETIKPTPNEIPAYLVACVDEDGVETGSYLIDYVKFSDFLNMKFNIHNLKKSLFVYNEKTNTYKGHTNQIETYTRNVFKEFDIVGKLSEIEKETITHVKSMGCIDKYPFCGKFGTVHVLNGCLDLKTGDVSKPDPASMYDYRIETEYNAFPKGTKELDTFLFQYGEAGKEVISVMAKCIWQRAYQDTVKEITVFYGPRDSGKTTLAEFIQITFDGDLNSKNNVGRALLYDLLQRFGYADLEGKLMNFGDDLPDMFIRNSGKINELVGSVIKHIEKKGIDAYDAVVTAYHVFTANHLPPLDDDDDIIWAKIRLVEFKTVVSVPKVPRVTLFTKLLREQLLFRAVQTAISYNAAPYTNDQKPDEVREAWHAATTDIDIFMREEIIFEPFEKTSLDAIKNYYGKWCDDNKKTRHIKYLTKRLQQYWRKSEGMNYYNVRLKGEVTATPPPTEKTTSLSCRQGVL